MAPDKKKRPQHVPPPLRIPQTHRAAADALTGAAAKLETVPGTLERCGANLDADDPRVAQINDLARIVGVLVRDVDRLATALRTGATEVTPELLAPPIESVADMAADAWARAVRCSEAIGQLAAALADGGTRTHVHNLVGASKVLARGLAEVQNDLADEANAEARDE